jgi:hypothetical protein
MEVKAKIGKPFGITPPNNERALAVKRPAHDVRKDEGKSFARLELKATEMRLLFLVSVSASVYTLVFSPQKLQLSHFNPRRHDNPHYVSKTTVQVNEMDMQERRQKLLNLNKIRGFDESHPISVSGDARYNNRLESGVGKTLAAESP